MGHDCGHDCCDTRDNPYHDHTMAPEDCFICEEFRRTGIVPGLCITPIDENENKSE